MPRRWRTQLFLARVGSFALISCFPDLSFSSHPTRCHSTARTSLLTQTSPPRPSHTSAAFPRAACSKPTAKGLCCRVCAHPGYAGEGRTPALLAQPGALAPRPHHARRFRRAAPRPPPARRSDPAPRQPPRERRGPRSPQQPADSYSLSPNTLGGRRGGGKREERAPRTELRAVRFSRRASGCLPTPSVPPRPAFPPPPGSRWGSSALVSSLPVLGARQLS